MTPTSATGRSNNTHKSRPNTLRGFSLLEVLVVVFIVGVLATMFTLSVGVTGGDRELETEVKRLIAVIDLAREEAVIEGREIGMRFYDDGYDFSAFYEDFVEYHDEENPDQSDWVMFDQASLLGPRSLPEGLLIELEIEGRQVVLNPAAEQVPETVDEDGSEDARADTFRPQVMIYSSGDISPFSLLVRREFSTSGTLLEFDVDGSVEIDDGHG